MWGMDGLGTGVSPVGTTQWRSFPPHKSSQTNLWKFINTVRMKQRWWQLFWVFNTPQHHTHKFPRFLDQKLIFIACCAAVHVLFSLRSGSICMEDALSIELTLDFGTTQGEIKWKVCEMLLSSEKQYCEGCIWIDWPKVLELPVCFMPTLYEPLKEHWEVSYTLSFPWSRWFVSSAVQHCAKHSWSSLTAPWNGTYLQWPFDFVSFSANFIHLCLCLPATFYITWYNLLTISGLLHKVTFTLCYLLYPLNLYLYNIWFLFLTLSCPFQLGNPSFPCKCTGSMSLCWNQVLLHAPGTCSFQFFSACLAIL